jgi:hypothetical protein
MYNNTAGISAGAIVVEVNSTVHLSNTVVASNIATSSHAGAILVRGTLTVNSCMFDSNAASTSFGKGGAIGAEDFTANIAVTNSTFTKCGAYMGGAISCHGILDIKQVRAPNQHTMMTALTRNCNVVVYTAAQEIAKTVKCSANRMM